MDETKKETLKTKLSEKEKAARAEMADKMVHLWETGFTGNITINCKHGVPMNYNVNYTGYQRRPLTKEIEDLKKQLNQSYKED